MKAEQQTLELIKEIDMKAINSILEIISRRCVSCRGEWRYTRHFRKRYRMCPFCGIEKEEDSSTDWNFCPRCGAYLEKGEEE